MKMKPISLAAALLVALYAAFGTSSAPHAQEVVATHGDWIVYTYQENGQKVCYIASRPSKAEGTFKKRGEPYATVTRRQGAEEVSVTAGYPFKEGSRVEAAIGGTMFNLFTENEWAWTQNDAADKQMIAAMERGSAMTVRGESQLDTRSIDTYSLKGFTAARKAMAGACG
ncbi:MAG: invasion associated locus B family protein [Alphaproteobacteria bacterium]